MQGDEKLGLILGLTLTGLLGLAMLAYHILPQLPPSVPDYPNAQQVQEGTGKGLDTFPGQIRSFVTSDKLEEVRSFYKSAMTRAGWRWLPPESTVILPTLMDKAERRSSSVYFIKTINTDQPGADAYFIEVFPEAMAGGQTYIRIIRQTDRYAFGF